MGSSRSSRRVWELVNELRPMLLRLDSNYKNQETENGRFKRLRMKSTKSTAADSAVRRRMELCAMFAL
jgi:hypothetical protein